MCDELLWNTLGETAWTAYVKSLGGKSPDGNPLPSWQEMVQDTDNAQRQLTVTAWRIASLAVAERLIDEIEKHPRFLKQTT